MRLLFLFFFLSVLPVQTMALEIQAPAPPGQALQWMPEETGSFAEALAELLQRVTGSLGPDLREAAQLCVGIFAVSLLVGLISSVSAGTSKLLDLSGVTAISAMLAYNTNSMIHLASDTVYELMEYGKLLLPVMGTALAAQGGMTRSAALYAGSAGFAALLQAVIVQFLLPGVYLFLITRIGSSATGDSLLKKMGDFLKNTVSWCLKTLLTIFTTYLSLTGVISGTTDAAAMKATKITISTVVPVVGGVLSEASEAVLVSASVLKNAAGIYGILAVLAVFAYPFLKIACHYFLLKLTEAACSILGNESLTQITGSFSSAMGLLLGITAACCIMVLISTVCFMKGIG